MVLEKTYLQVIKKELNTHNFLPREKRIFRINVGEIPEDQVEAYIRSIRDMMRRQPIMDWVETPLERQARLKRERRARHGRPRRLW
jgi:hypothetical protein